MIMPPTPIIVWAVALVVFLIVEAIRRKPIPPEKEGMVHAIGLGLFFLLFIFLTYHDIVRIVTGGM